MYPNSKEATFWSAWLFSSVNMTASVLHHCKPHTRLRWQAAKAGSAWLLQLSHITAVHRSCFRYEFMRDVILHQDISKSYYFVILKFNSHFSNRPCNFCQWASLLGQTKCFVTERRHLWIAQDNNDQNARVGHKHKDSSKTLLLTFFLGLFQHRDALEGEKSP